MDRILTPFNLTRNFLGNRSISRLMKFHTWPCAFNYNQNLARPYSIVP